ncbi:type IV secretion system protein VirB3 [Chamaesiphon sp.]|uniref:type IV secretion system protein VirB3 n=1 Tax=Chamaesiphon sp. TaxID=2814140 RepID=UPI003594353E
MEDDDRLELNKAARRRTKLFGISGDSALVLFGVFTFCALLGYLGLPINITVAILVVVTLTAAFLVKDGTGEFIARIRSPIQYTRGCWIYQSPLKPQKSNRKRK